jgi:hypothetical protein
MECPLYQIRVIRKLPNSEQSYKGKVKTHNYINRQISQQPENCENRNDPIRSNLFHNETVDGIKDVKDILSLLRGVA